MYRFLLALLLCILPLTANAFECNGHVALGVPSSADQLLCRSGYAAGYSYQAKQSFWTAYHLTAKSVGVRMKRSNNFHVDTEIPAQHRSTLADYKRSGYDRGHLVPNAAIDTNYQSMSESFLMSNISPQKAGLNRQGWRYLEEYIRNWTADRGELYVATGPLFEGELQAIGHGVIVPSHFWKVIYDNVSKEMIAFIVPHQPVSKSDIPSCIVSVDEVEQRAGMDFYSTLEDDLEEELEEARSAMW